MAGEVREYAASCDISKWANDDGKESNSPAPHQSGTWSVEDGIWSDWCHIAFTFPSTTRAYGKAARNGNGNGNRNGNGMENCENSCTVVSNTGLDSSKLPVYVGQKLNMLIQPITCSWAWSGILPRVSRGQRSRAYLISCNEKLRRALTWLILNRNQFPALIEAYRTELCHQLQPWSLLILLKLIKYARDLCPILTRGKTSSRHV